MLGSVKHFLMRQARVIKSKSKLKSAPRLAFHPNNLGAFSEQELSKIFQSPTLGAEWEKAKTEIDQVCRIADLTTDGVNIGDRRAIWYLVSALKPRAVLECGTHVGASTVHIAAALKVAHAPQQDWRFVTLDIIDVNDSQDSYWKKYGLSSSPRQMIEQCHCGQNVTFTTESSTDFLKRAADKFDLIFLDGDHVSATVYQEIQLSLERLNPGGLILLHDYFPKNRPLWNNGALEAGPYLAVKRIISEGAGLRVIPFGKLPWPTKLGSHITSLAVVVKN
jgi:predicted O-methyltransferase YrrM